MKQDFRNLVVWQKAIALVTEVYRAIQSFPNEEKFGLTSPLRRASVSIPSHIAEGQGRLTRGEFRHVLGNAKGSLREVEPQLIIAHNLGSLNDPQPLQEKPHEVARGLNGLLNSLTNPQPTTFAVTVHSTARISMRDAASYTGLKESGQRLRTRLRNPVHLVE
jgi:four helix bundle protein